MTHVLAMNERTRIEQENKISEVFNVGDKVYKVSGYQFPSTVVSVFRTTAGKVRVVAELDDLGLLHIFNEQQLAHFPTKV